MNMIRKLILSVMLSYATLSLANESLPDQIAAGPTQLKRCAVVPMKVMGFVRIGDAALYLDDCGSSERILDDIPKQFSISLKRDASGQRLKRMAEDLLADNLSTELLEQAQFNCVTEAYIDAEKGDQYDVRYLPEQGLELILNGEILASCPVQTSSPLYFSIWFGEDPFNKKLRDALLNASS